MIPQVTVAACSQIPPRLLMKRLYPCRKHGTPRSVQAARLTCLVDQARIAEAVAEHVRDPGADRFWYCRSICNSNVA